MPARRLAVITTLVVLAAWGTPALSQAPAPPSLQFEVASIKPNVSGDSRSSSNMPPIGLYRAVNMSLRQLMIDAFRVRSFQISGPDWIDNDKFDIQARTSDDAPQDQMRAMLQALLRERFNLVVHNESREQPVYLLVPDRADRRLGPAMKLSECSAGCGMNTNISNGAGTMKATGRTMGQLAAWASNMVDRIVIDRTGMPGSYDVELSFTRDIPGAAAAAQDPPSIFTAVREQLGLRLESGRGPVDFVVIDRVSRPTPD